MTTMIRLPIVALAGLLACAVPAAAQAPAAKQPPKPAPASKPAQKPKAAPSGPSTPASPEEQTKSLNLTAYAELLRSDVRAEKIAIMTEVMGFTEDEDKAFWPIYREYDAEMSKLGDERVENIADYAKNFDSLNDEAADRLAKKALDLAARRGQAEAQFYDRVAKALSPKTALKALQVEHQLLLLIDLQIAAALPIAK